MGFEFLEFPPFGAANIGLNTKSRKIFFGMPTFTGKHPAFSIELFSKKE